MKIPVIITLIALWVLIPGHTHGQTDNVLQNESAFFYFNEHLRYAALRAAELYPSIKGDLENMLGWQVNFRPVIMLQDGDGFRRMTESDLVVAFALPDRDLMVIDYSRMKTTPFSLEATMKHELCHLLLHKNIKSKNLPRWLDEGIAQWVSGGLADIIMHKKSVLDEAVLSNRFLGLKSLDECFPMNNKHLSLAYAESKSIVEYTISKYGKESILEILSTLRNGGNIDSAVMKTLKISLNDLEKRWRSSLTKKSAWIYFLTSNLYRILFFFGALILIFGFIRLIMRKRAYEEEDQD